MTRKPESFLATLAGLAGLVAFLFAFYWLLVAFIAP